MLATFIILFVFIREQITPKGDGNNIISPFFSFNSMYIREQITPKGDGNKMLAIFKASSFFVD